MTHLTDLLAGNEDTWATDPRRPCASPIDAPEYIRDHADSWYPREKYYDAATVLCAGCAVINDCLKYALENNEEHGIFGGTTPKDRAKLLRKQRRQAAA